MKILFLTKQPYPYGSAYSTRSRAITDALTALGHTVTVFCSSGGDNDTDRRYFDTHPRVSRVIISEKKGAFQSFAETNEYVAEVTKFLATNGCDIVISSSMYDKIAPILKVVREQRVPIILESCEWFHYSSWTFGKLDPRYWLFSYAWRHYFPHADGYITISRLLENHYSKTGKPILRIPTITDVSSIVPRLNMSGLNKRITLMFAGRFGGTKDDVAPFARAIASDEELLRTYALVIVGPSREEVFAREDKRESFSVLEKAGALRIIGQLSQEQVEEAYRKTDFGCFMRPRRRSSDAGFSTKLGEGMAVGTPFIVNNTGDISNYIENGVSGFVLKDVTPGSIQMVLRNVLHASAKDRAAMRVAARSVAERFFDWRSYTDALSQLLADVTETYYG